MTKTAIVIGATSGIGYALVLKLVDAGYRVIATGRRSEKLEALRQYKPEHIHIQTMDVQDDSDTRLKLDALWNQFTGIDLVVINAGVGFLDSKLPWDKDKTVINTNVLGGAAVANWCFNAFRKQGHGHIVGISSVAMHRGGSSVAYNASKAFLSRYLEGLRFICAKKSLPIWVTDIRPGFVDTDLAGGKRLFWMISAEQAAEHIIAAIRRRKKVAYVSPKWRLIASLLNWLPDWLYHKI